MALIGGLRSVKKEAKMKKVVAALMLTAFLFVSAGSVMAQSKTEPPKKEHKSFWSKFHKKTDKDKKNDNK
jgi:hypothetical protein